MGIKDMEHMDMEWECRKNGIGFAIYTAELEPWAICNISFALPGCETGEATASAICDEHNAALAARKANNQSKDA